MAEHTFLKELRDFLAFLGSLWGMLAAVSVLFPLSNQFFTVIPLDVFQKLRVEIVTTVTMLTCIFVTFATFGRRHQFAQEALRARRATAARVSFAIAIASLAAFVLARNGAYRALVSDWEGEWGIALYDGLFAGPLYCDVRLHHACLPVLGDARVLRTQRPTRTG